MTAAKNEAQKQGSLLAERVEEKRIAKRHESDIGKLLEAAVDKNVPVETLEKLVNLQERMLDRQSAADFSQALADFQEWCPAISKQSVARIATRGGASYSYKYAELDHIVDTIRPGLKQFGFSYAWDSTFDNGMLSVTCKLRHAGGHSSTATFAAPVQSSAGMSDQQKHAAALSYARRQSLIQVLGLTTCDPDTDAGSTETITESQQADLAALIEEVGADEKRFLAYMGVESLAKITEVDFRKAVVALEAKRSRG